MFEEKELKSHTRRSFQITIGLTEGYESTVRHTKEEVIILIGEHNRERLNSDECKFCVLGGMLVPATVVHSRNVEKAQHEMVTEDVLLFMGDISPVYHSDVTDAEVVEALKSLASYLGEKLHQGRMYVTYGNNIFVLHNPAMKRPAGRP